MLEIEESKKQGEKEMNVNGNSIDLVEVILIFSGVLIGICILAILFFAFVKNKDKNKELISKKVTVLEKPIQQGNVEWYVMECQNGDRIKLRSFQGNSLFISVGDKGIVSYRGQTIESFKRQ